MGKITIKNRISKSETFNVANEKGKFNIECEVTIENGVMAQIRNIRASLANGRELFNGNLFGNSLNGALHGDADNPNDVIISEVDAFVADVKALDFSKEVEV